MRRSSEWVRNPILRLFLQGLLPVGVDDAGDLVRLVSDSGKRTRHGVDRNQIIGLAEAGKTDQQAHVLVDSVDVLVNGLAYSGFPGLMD